MTNHTLPKQLSREIARAREEERKHVARELHDQIIQALIGLGYHLSQIQDQSGSEIDQQLAQVRANLHCILNDVRNICIQLRPVNLQRLGLFATIQSCVTEMRSRTKLPITLNFAGDTDLPIAEDTALCIFRMLEEALTNVWKHAQARQVSVCIALSPHELTLSVRDDGLGFAVPHDTEQLLRHKRFGLIGMRERLELLDGTLQITSHPGMGTVLRAHIPLPGLSGREQDSVAEL